jgi:tRNA (guanine-N7-)-methyltransferase
MVDGGGSAAPTTERLPPWNNPRVVQSAKKRKRSNNNSARFRQHVNPLARQYQQPTLLSDDWPADVFDDCSRPLHLDIGCGKGGFLLDLASQEGDDANGASATRFNYLGLEIRPLVAQYARERIAVHGLTGRLDFLGCNANVDLERLLRRYQRQYDAKAGEPLAALRRVTIQFPDPHFKSHHAKRRVVTPAVVTTLARFMPAGATVFLQSDVRSVLDDMRQRFRESALYFADSLEDAFDEYLPENILGVPTEREVSVLKKDLPVYRALFTRTSTFVPPGG